MMISFKFKKSLRLFFLNAFLLGVLSACGGGESSSSSEDVGSSSTVIAAEEDIATIPVSVPEKTPAPVPPVVEPVPVIIPPVAGISANPTRGETNLNVRFIASDTGNSQSSIVSYTWSFGDGASGTGANISHTYTTAGSYTANVTLTNADGLTSRATQQIVVTEPAAPAPPVASMSANPTRGEATLRVSFSATDTSNSTSPVSSYQWNFGDGGSVTGANASHSYTRAGTYNVVVTIINEYGQSASASRQIIVTDPVVLEPPVVAISANPVQGEATLQVNFSGADTSNSGSAITSYQWDLGDGNSAEGASVQHDYTTAGTYTATLSMRNDNGLTATATQQIVVTDPTPAILPVAVISADPTSGSASLQVSFSATNDSSANIVDYNWNFGDGNTASGPNVIHNYDTPNIYTATLTLTDSNGETDSTIQQIYVFDSIDNSQAIVPTGVTFYDNFDYSVSRNAPDISAERSKFI
ncbi:MAG: PKD domain-containing protein, partial [Gammaproteobacteria bacterium]|nr:PKD domain-containing protein [Gammaproteobacteria bacterium]